MRDEGRLSAVVSEEESVVAAYLFGSYAKGTARPTSDLDLALVFRDGLNADERFAIRCDLSERAARVVGVTRADVIDLETAPPFRNILVHDYLGVDQRRVHGLLQRLDDLAELGRVLGAHAEKTDS